MVEITPQGVVRIATLDGVVMEGYINSSKLKRFYGPLTLQALKPSIAINGGRRKRRRRSNVLAKKLKKER